MAIPSTKTEQLFFDLIEACRTREAFTNTGNRFYDKVEERILNTGVFYHPKLDVGNQDLFDRATYYLDQVRVNDISKDSYATKYESIRSQGILEPGWAYLDHDPTSKWEATVIDMITRIVLARTCEENEHVDSSISIPINIITCKALIQLIRKHKKSFQILANDHPPADASSSHDIKKLIRELVHQESLPPAEHTDKFKRKLAEHVQRMVSKNARYATVRKYVSEVYNTLDQSRNGVKGYVEPKNRATVVRKALETGKGNLKLDPTKWSPDRNEYNHETFKVYQGSPSRGSLEKDYGTEIVRKADPEFAGKESVYVFRTDAVTPAKVREAQVAAFAKINKMHTWTGKVVFDHVFALGQITNIDQGQLLSETDVLAAQTKLKLVS